MKFKVVLCFLLILTATFSFISCNENDTVYYSVKFDSNGGSFVASATVKNGDKVSKPQAPTKDGYDFIGWYYENTEWNFDKNEVTEDIMLTAKWEKLHTVSYYDGDELIESLTLKNATKLEKPADPQKDGYIFLGWYIGENLWIFEVNTVTTDTVLRAKWQAISEIPDDCTVKFDTDGGTGGEDTLDRTVSAGSKITKPHDPTKEGFLFIGWFVDNEIWDFENSPVTQNLTITAKWKEYFTVSFDTDGGSIIAPIEVLEGDTLTAPTTPTKDGFDFDAWIFDGAEWDFSTPITQDITLSANWIKYFTVSFDTDGGSAVAPIKVLQGNALTEPAAPNKDDHKFLGWFIDGEEWNFETEISADITLTAKWKLALTVTFNVNGATNMDNFTVMVELGEKVEKPAIDPTNNALTFYGWVVIEDKIETDFNFDEPITSSITITAKWIVNGTTLPGDPL